MWSLHTVSAVYVSVCLSSCSVFLCLCLFFSSSLLNGTHSNKCVFSLLKYLTHFPSVTQTPTHINAPQNTNSVLNTSISSLSHLAVISVNWKLVLSGFVVAHSFQHSGHTLVDTFIFSISVILSFCHLIRFDFHCALLAWNTIASSTYSAPATNCKQTELEVVTVLHYQQRVQGSLKQSNVQVLMNYIRLGHTENRNSGTIVMCKIAAHHNVTVTL